MCVGCGRRFAKNALVRFTVRGDKGNKTIALDKDGTAAGRGVYVCLSRSCFDKAAGKKVLQRRLGAASGLTLPREDFIRLLKLAGD
ncbi:MAG TPA: YlxR family protein [Actinobacteria bacterium]|nr:YlxR family protein [Actinomycetota bacterium]